MAGGNMMTVGQTSAGVDEKDERESELLELRAKIREMWKPFDVFCVVVVVMFIVTAAWIGLSTGTDYVHIGNSGCVISHDGFNDMHLQCGTEMSGSGPSSVPAVGGQ